MERRCNVDSRCKDCIVRGMIDLALTIGHKMIRMLYSPPLVTIASTVSRQPSASSSLGALTTNAILWAVQIADSRSHFAVYGIDIASVFSIASPMLAVSHIILRATCSEGEGSV